MLLAFFIVNGLLVSSVRVAVLRNHDSNAWQKDCPCLKAPNLNLVECNLKVYQMAATTAASVGTDILVLPEAYGLTGSPSRSTFYEPLITSPGSLPCGNTSISAKAPQQYALSCMAKEQNLAVAANIFTELANGTRRITELVFDSNGVQVSRYDKHHLFLTESKHFTPGPFHPTTFDLVGRRWGIVICWEGVYPTLSRDFSQFDSLVKDQNATGIVWSIGRIPVVLNYVATSLANRYNVPILASTLGDSEIVRGNGTAEGYVDTDIAGLEALGYTNKLAVRSLVLNDE